MPRAYYPFNQDLSLSGELDRVCHQVVQNLLKPSLVKREYRIMSGDLPEVKFDLNLLVVDGQTRNLDDFLKGFRH